MQIGPTTILDTHAEAFAAQFTRLIISAADEYWLTAALNAVTGYGTSVIGCDCEAGVERRLAPEESPDGRPAAAVLMFAFSAEKLARAVGNRVGQCVLTCPTTACYNGLPDAAERYRLGDYVRYFGDGSEKPGARSEERGPKVEEREDAESPPSPLTPHSSPLPWHIPVFDGEFLVDASAGVAPGIAGGNLIIQGAKQQSALAAAGRAAGAIAPLPGVITPFPGGVCRSGSKVGSKYKNLVASTSEEYCPTLRDRVDSQLVDGANCAYEIVIDGVDEAAVAAAMRAAIEAAAGEGVLAIGAAEFAGRLGKIQFRLHDLFAAP